MEYFKDSFYDIYLSFISAFHVLLATKPYVPELIIRPMLEDLQETLEKTENHLIVPTLVNSLALISRQQPRLFEPRFQVITLWSEFQDFRPKTMKPFSF